MAGKKRKARINRDKAKVPKKEVETGEEKVYVPTEPDIIEQPPDVNSWKEPKIGDIEQAAAEKEGKFPGKSSHKKQGEAGKKGAPAHEGKNTEEDDDKEEKPKGKNVETDSDVAQEESHEYSIGHENAPPDTEEKLEGLDKHRTISTDPKDKEQDKQVKGEVKEEKLNQDAPKQENLPTTEKKVFATRKGKTKQEKKVIKEEPSEEDLYDGKTEAKQNKESEEAEEKEARQGGTITPIRKRAGDRSKKQHDKQGIKSEVEKAELNQDAPKQANVLIAEKRGIATKRGKEKQKKGDNSARIEPPEDDLSDEKPGTKRNKMSDDVKQTGADSGEVCAENEKSFKTSMQLRVEHCKS